MAGGRDGAAASQFTFNMICLSLVPMGHTRLLAARNHREALFIAMRYKKDLGPHVAAPPNPNPQSHPVVQRRKAVAEPGWNAAKPPGKGLEVSRQLQKRLRRLTHRVATHAICAPAASTVCPNPPLTMDAEAGFTPLPSGSYYGMVRI
jgi:hypothetical protein